MSYPMHEHNQADETVELFVFNDDVEPHLMVGTEDYDAVPFRAVEDVEIHLAHKSGEWAAARKSVLADLDEAEDGRVTVATVTVHEVTDGGVCGDYEIEWEVDVPEDAPAGRDVDDTPKEASA